MGYKVNGKEYDFDSITNQEIKGKFVHREVYCNANSMVEYILGKWDYDEAPFTYDDVENYYEPVCSECGDTYGFEEVEDGYKCQGCDHIFDEDEYNCLDTEPQEIYEWWLCSSWLIEKLKDEGKCIIEEESIWGRCTTGQAILLDGVISKICYNMKILEGQEHEWK